MVTAIDRYRGAAFMDSYTEVNTSQCKLFFSMVRTRCTTLRVGAAKDCEFFFLYSFIWSGLIIIIIIIALSFANSYIRVLYDLVYIF